MNFEYYSTVEKTQTWSLLGGYKPSKKPEMFRDTCSGWFVNEVTTSVIPANKDGQKHGRRIDLEDKAKVVAYAWGAESLPR